MMNTATLKSFLIALSSKLGVEHERLYQLLQSAEASYYLRDTDKQLELGLTLQMFPYPFNQVGSYYEAVCLYRNQQYQKAKSILEDVSENAPARYRSKALLSLSAVEETLGNFEEAMRLRLQSASSNDPLTVVEANWGIAVLKSIEGDKQAALKQLEEFLPLATMVGKVVPPVGAAHLNSYAVELSNAGRMEEARNVSNLLIASPYIHRFAEIRETVEEIYEKSNRSSMVSFARTPGQVIQFPGTEEEEPEEAEEPYTGPTIDLLDDCTVMNLVQTWTTEGVKPEELGQVITALTEIDDYIQKDLVHEVMTRFAFMESKDFEKAVRAWREKVYARVKPTREE